MGAGDDGRFVLVGVRRAGVCCHRLLFAASQTNGGCVMAIDREWEFFQASVPALLEKDAGRYVLIHGDQIAGVWDTKAQALEEGYRRFLLEPFLVQHIVADEKPIF